MLLPPAAAAQPADPPPPGSASPNDEITELPKVVARVDGAEVSRAELLAQTHIARLQMAKGGLADPGRSRGFYLEVLDALIGERLIFADTQERGIQVADEDVDQAVDKLVGTFGGDQVAEHLDRDVLRRMIRRSMTLDKAMRTEIAPQLQLTEEVLRQAYEQSREQMRLPELHKFRHIVMVPAEGGGAAAEEQARGKLLELKQQVAGGADFAELARQHSQDASSREAGGELPWAVVAGRPSALEQTVAALAVGEVSDVVKSDSGLHLVQLIDHQPERVKTFEEVKDQLAHQLLMLGVREEIQRRLKQLRATAQIEILM